MGIVIDSLPVYLRVHGVSLAAIGVFSSLTLPWTLKPLWAPLVDRFGERRHIGSPPRSSRWRARPPRSRSRTPPSRRTVLVAAVLLLTIAGATQDIAIDAYTIGLLRPGRGRRRQRRPRLGLSRGADRDGRRRAAARRPDRLARGVRRDELRVRRAGGRRVAGAAGADRAPARRRVGAARSSRGWRVPARPPCSSSSFSTSSAT